MSNHKVALFELKICDIEKVQHYVDRGWPTHIISLVGHDMPDYGARHLNLFVHDIAKPRAGYVHPTPDHIRQILEFTKNLTVGDRVLIHCEAGISRSTAAAIGILIQHGMRYDEAHAYVARLRPMLSPNELLIDYIDERFKLDGQLSQLVEHKRELAEEQQWDRIAELAGVTSV